MSHKYILPLILCFLASIANAASVKSPYIVKGEFEFEQSGKVTFDRDRSKSDEHELEFEFSYSPTAFWKTAIAIEAAREAGLGEEFRYQAFIWESTFALAAPGKYWIDPAAYLEFEFARDDEPNAVTGGFIGSTSWGPLVETFNLFIKKEYEPDHSAASFIYTNQVKYRLCPWLTPGFEIYGETGGKSQFDQQELAIGPVLFGSVDLRDAFPLSYELGVLFGATAGTPDTTIRWKLEYEF